MTELRQGIDTALTDFWRAYTGNNQYRAPENVFNPTAWYNPQPSQEERQQQQAASGFYRGLMNGNQPSLAQQQMQQGIAQANRTGMQSASAARGIDRAAAFRQAQNNAAQLTAQGAIAGGQQRLQEQQLGAQGLMQGSTGIRQQDVGEQLGLAGAQNQAQQNLNQQYAINAGITNQNMNREQQAANSGVASIGALLSDIRAKENVQPTGGFLQSVDAPEQNQQSGFDIQRYLQSQNQPKQENSGGVPGLSSLTSLLSDERSKENLSGIHGFVFDYKDGDAHRMASEAAKKAYVEAFLDAKKPRAGVMAQELAANPKDSPIVSADGNNRLELDTKRLLGFIAANQAGINERLTRLEGGTNGRA